ncbi:MAG: AbrB/MazE/SpoVT family DNA-binding domain-containing protein [bacterium]
MKSTGIVRKVDDLGRIVLPIELRRTLHIDEKDPLEIYVNGDNIILRKYEPTCVFCGKTENIVNFKDKKVCSSCVDTLNQLQSLQV